MRPVEEIMSHEQEEELREVTNRAEVVIIEKTATIDWYEEVLMDGKKTAYFGTRDGFKKWAEGRSYMHLETFICTETKDTHEAADDEILCANPEPREHVVHASFRHKVAEDVALAVANTQLIVALRNASLALIAAAETGFWCEECGGGGWICLVNPHEHEVCPFCTPRLTELLKGLGVREPQ